MTSLLFFQAVPAGVLGTLPTRCNPNASKGLGVLYRELLRAARDVLKHVLRQSVAPEYLYTAFKVSGVQNVTYDVRPASICRT